MSRLRASRPIDLRRMRTVALVAFFTLLTTLACSLAGSSAPTSGTAGTSPAMRPTVSPTAEYTPTPLPPLAVLVAPEGDAAGDSLDPVVASLSGEAGLRFERLTELPADLAGAQVALAVIVTPIENLAGLAEAAPDTQFISVGLSGLSPSANLTVVGTLADRSDEVGFLGGYLAALVAADWRVASLSQPDSTIGATTRLAFANGARYLCGLCRPVNSPYPGYPLDYPAPPQGDEEARRSLLAQLVRDGVEILFVQQGLADPDLVDALTEAGVHLIAVGASEPSTAWMAAIQGDPAEAVRSVWSGVVGGESAGSVPLPLHVVVYDANRLTPGRYQHLQTILNDLEGGFIDTGVDPLTGNPD